MALRFRGFILICLWLSVCVAVQAQNTYLQKTRTFHTAEEFARMTKGEVKIHRSPQTEFAGWPIDLIGTNLGAYIQNKDKSGIYPFPSNSLLPVNQINVVAGQPKWPMTFWFGTTQGAFLFTAGNGKTNAFYFAGKRWLPDDNVTGFGFEIKPMTIWIETPKGFSRIDYKRMTLADKSRTFVDSESNEWNR